MQTVYFWHSLFTLCVIVMSLAASADNFEKEIKDEGSSVTAKTPVTTEQAPFGSTKRPRPTRRERVDLTKHIRACYKELDLSKADAYKIVRGTLERSDEKAQCFVNCVYLRVGVMDKDGVINEEKLKKMLPKSVFDPVRVPEWISKCREEQGQTQCERSYNMYNCFLKMAFPAGTVEMGNPKGVKESSMEKKINVTKVHPFAIGNLARIKE